jgi:hypothetical protein
MMRKQFKVQTNVKAGVTTNTLDSLRCMTYANDCANGDVAACADGEAAGCAMPRVYNPSDPRV